MKRNNYDDGNCVKTNIQYYVKGVFVRKTAYYHFQNHILKCGLFNSFFLMYVFQRRRKESLIYLSSNLYVHIFYTFSSSLFQTVQDCCIQACFLEKGMKKQFRI